MVTPGVSRGTRIMDCWRWRSAEGSVLPITMKISACGFSAPGDPPLAPVDHVLVTVALDAGGDVGGVGGGHVGLGHRERRGGSGRRAAAAASVFAARVCRTWRAPPCCLCPGAEQFSAVGARPRLRPVISASGAYCRLVSPAPCSPGRNRCPQPSRPCLSARSSASTGTVLQGPQRFSSAASCSLKHRPRPGKRGRVHELEQHGPQFLGPLVKTELHQLSSSPHRGQSGSDQGLDQGADLLEPLARPSGRGRT